jgi:hypothetical protein
MANNMIIIKKELSNLDKKLILYNKKLIESNKILKELGKDLEILKGIRRQSNISKTYYNKIKEIIDTTKLVDNSLELYKTSENNMETITEVKLAIRESHNYFEKYRTQRVYKISEAKKIFRFLSSFLEGFAEHYDFKPQFIGIIKLDEFAAEVDGKLKGTKIEIKYTKLPNLIEKAYEKGLRNFVIESHNLKLLFQAGYIVKINAKSDMIRRIDRIAKEIEIEVIE